MKKLRHLLEYCASLFGLFLLDRISPSTAEHLAIKMADLWYCFNSLRRQIACDNIRRSGITPSDSEVNRIARESFRHLAVLVVESLKSGNVFDENNWREKVEIDIHPETMEILKEPGRGVILVSGHFGNWEVAAQLLSYIKPVTGITRDMDNPYTDKLMKERKPRNRFQLTPKHDAGVDRLLSVLKNGEILALMIDQHAMGRGMAINFFGMPASTHTSPALLHLVTRAPLCFGYCIRKGPMSYKFKAIAPIIHKPTGNRENDVRVILEMLTIELENAIRQNPEQYLWAHRRWKIKPPSANQV
ncbi:MAG: lysophospholipid acyltransferase family protein [Kiritimatiellae bacterium]|nr:lysophospholipid acyltransferase family protein [Kiritimatiellia bacterium]MDD5520673.1 lysophospholipid acyltransferase family protein [Kiritimatiellia bacterium]